jgi:Lon protease-like protein
MTALPVFPRPMFPLPMFPLGTVLFPHAYLPIHVFEPRYRALVADCLSGDEVFGVVLIERGSEVGGGDVRTNLGTTAKILQAQPLPDGRWLLLAVGGQRIRVVQWLSDDPYPRAEVAELRDGPPTPVAASLVAEATKRLRRALALKAELGEWSGDLAFELDSDPAIAAYQAAAGAPIGPTDAQGLLAVDDPDERLERLMAMLDAATADLEFRLGGA